jgi:hypothetical protein
MDGFIERAQSTSPLFTLSENASLIKRLNRVSKLGCVSISEYT